MNTEFRGSNETARLIIALARDAVESYIGDGRIAGPPQEMIPELRGRAGAFVCLKKFGELRGCIGTFEPTQDNLAEEIIQNAISSATRDPRFSAVSSEELDFLTYTVDVLGPCELATDPGELDPKRYGIIVESGARRGLLLPDLEGVESAEQQISIASQKAGISPGEPVRIFRFEVSRYEE